MRYAHLDQFENHNTMHKYSFFNKCLISFYFGVVAHRMCLKFLDKHFLAHELIWQWIAIAQQIIGRTCCIQVKILLTHYKIKIKCNQNQQR
jgi:hypothetical protein